MSTYRVKDLLDRLNEMFQQGCEYTELSIEEETAPATLTLKGIIDEETELECKTIASCSYGDENDNDSDDENCYEVQFTYDEIATIASALANMPSIYKNAINDESYDSREREAFQTMSDKMLALKEKIELAFKNFK